jgi:SAM-dependent methyltransferase
VRPYATISVCAIGALPSLLGRGRPKGTQDMTRQRDRWAELTGGQAGEEYARRFERLAASGHDVHGEAAFCSALLEPAARVLDAGCGTGRIAIRLAELGHHCTGVDIDQSMLAVARRNAPALTWLHGDLARLDDLSLEPGFDLAVAAGNVIPLLAPGTEPAVVRRLAAVLRPGGLLVTGMGLDAEHLPLPEPTVTLTDFDHWCTQAGLTLQQRFATWDAAPYHQGGGYAVSVHSRPECGEEG